MWRLFAGFLEGELFAWTGLEGWSLALTFPPLSLDVSELQLGRVSQVFAEQGLVRLGTILISWWGSEKLWYSLLSPELGIYFPPIHVLLVTFFIYALCLFV